MMRGCDFIKNRFVDLSYTTIIVFFLMINVITIICIARMLYSNCNIGSLSEFVTAFATVLALIIACNEYFEHKDKKQAAILSEYNQRYSTDPNIIKVVQYLNYMDNGGKINNPIRVRPSNYEVEMFMRFFEELGLQIECGRLKQEDVEDLFLYYAKKLNENSDLRILLGIDEDDYKNYWTRFKKITSTNK